MGNTTNKVLGEALKVAYAAQHPMTTDDYERLAMRTEADQWKILQRLQQLGVDAMRLDNAARGLAGDAGEVASAVMKYIEYGRPLDKVNLIEEVGDCLWRLTQVCKGGGFTMQEAMRANIAKLAARYPDKYSDEQSANRDLEAERKAITSLNEMEADMLKQIEGKPPTPWMRQATGVQDNTGRVKETVEDMYIGGKEVQHPIPEPVQINAKLLEKRVPGDDVPHCTTKTLEATRALQAETATKGSGDDISYMGFKDSPKGEVFQPVVTLPPEEKEARDSGQSLVVDAKTERRVKMEPVINQDGHGFGHVDFAPNPAFCQGELQHDWQLVQTPAGSGYKCNRCGVLGATS